MQAQAAPASTAAAPPSTLLHTLSSHKGAVHTAIFNTGSSYLLTGGQDRQIKLWNPKKGTEVQAFSGHGYEVLGLACSHDNTRIASCGGDRSVFLWDVKTAETVKKFQGHSGKVNAVAFSADASVLASGSFDTTVRLWDLKSQQRMPIQVLEEAKDSVTSLVVQGHLVIAGSVDGFVRTYDIRQGELRTDFFDQPVTSLQLAADSAMLLVSTLDSTIRAMDLENGQMFQSFKGHKNSSYRSKVCFGVGEATVVMGDEDGKVWSWEVESGKRISEQRAHDRTILWTVHHPKEQQMATASADGTVKIWGTPDMKKAPRK